MSLGRKVDPGLDIGSLDAHSTPMKKTKAGEWDATHAGFPCGSFSRARHRAMEGMPGPVPDGDNIQVTHQSCPSTR